MLEHGGQLRSAAARYGIPLREWLDLSTGINPIPYTPPSIPLTDWAHLPQDNDGLDQAASHYYGSADLLVVAGSQAAIQALPRLRRNVRIGVLHPGYAEHALAWNRCGHDVHALDENQIATQLSTLDVVVLMQPNNPTGILFSHTQLHDWHEQLAARGGWLIVDEAFIEASEQPSIIQNTMPKGLIVLRSLGKFFGLAGARVGFVVAHTTVLSPLRELLGPWPVSGPSRLIAQTALSNFDWQATTRQRLQQDGARLAQLLLDVGFSPVSGCGLFQWVITEQAAHIHQELAQLGILTRLFNKPHSLRFGLPASETGWLRLHKALKQTT